MLNEKELHFLKECYHSQHPIHLDTIACQMGCSTRSIRLYLNAINTHFQQGVLSIKKSMIQVEEKTPITDFLSQHQNTMFSPSFLHSYMMLHILLQDGINLTHFVNQFQISRTTAKNYLTKVKNQLEDYHLTLEHTGAITLIGKEEEKRKLLLNILLQLPYKSKQELQPLSPLLHEFDQLEQSALLAQFLQLTLGQLDYTFSEHSHSILINYMLIVLYRQKRGHNITSIENKGFLMESKEFFVINPLFETLQVNLGSSFPLEEKLEVVNKIMGLHYSNNKEVEQHNWFEYDLFISRLIRRFATLSSCNVVGDFRLYEQLLNHIKPAIYRMTHGIKNHPFDVQSIKNHSLLEFNITATLFLEFHLLADERELLEVEDEVALITVYFKQAVDRFQEQGAKNLIFVCNYGYGSSRMIMEQLRLHFQLGTIKWVPSYDLNAIDLANFHLIVSTERLLTPSLPWVEITPFFSLDDRMKLGEVLSLASKQQVNGSALLRILETHCTIENKSKLLHALQDELGSLWNYNAPKTNTLLHFISTDAILLDVETQDIEELLHLSGHLLEKNGCILSSYTKDLVTSFENYGMYMMLDDHCAIPHTKNKNNVLRTGFSFVRLKSPLVYDGHALSMLFTFCTINNKEHLEALVLIADMMRNHSTKEALETLQTPEEIMDLFGTLNDASPWE